MNNYEIMILFKPDAAKDGLDAAVGQAKEILKKYNADCGDETDMGKQRLSYPIKKFKEANYYLINCHIEPKKVKEIEKLFKLNELILRTLIVKK